jgi:hypothetical protein
MLPHIVPSTISPCASLAHITWPGEALKVSGPRYALHIEEVYDSRHIFRDADKVIAVEAKVVAANRGNVIWLRGMREAKVLGEEDALSCEVGDVAIHTDFQVILRG